MVVTVMVVVATRGVGHLDSHDEQSPGFVPPCEIHLPRSARRQLEMVPLSSGNEVVAVAAVAAGGFGHLESLAYQDQHYHG